MDAKFGVIYSTNDLTKFTPSTYNRDIVVNKPLMNLIATSGWNPFNPLVVTANGNIVDGNGRYVILGMLCKVNGWDVTNMPIEITYIVDHRPMAEYDKIKEYNGYTRAWQGKDFITSYCRQGLRPYVEVEEQRYKVMKGKKPVLSVGHAIIAYSHNQLSTANPQVKCGKMPMGDAEFVTFIAQFIVDNKITHAGKTPFIQALVAWFSKIYPTLEATQKGEFMQSIKRYDGNRFGEKTDHIAEWQRWVGISGHELNAKKRAALFK